MVKKPSLITHYAVGQRYPGVREDGRRVDMVQIACEPTRVFLPRGHDFTHSIKITCRRCIVRLIESYEEDIAILQAALPGAVSERFEYKISQRARGQERLRQWIKNNREPDHETLERIKNS